MTTIHITNANGLKRIICEGHATGHPDACAALSLLCMALLERINGESGGGYITDGNFKAVFDEHDGEFELFLTAVRMLAREMPEACKIIENNIVTL